MILIIDNYDSFTYNLVQAVGSQGYEVQVVLNDQVTTADIQRLRPERIILSPGPGRPGDAGICLETIRTFYQSVPILGVCLGHQCIGKVFGSSIIQARRLLHGKTSAVYHDDSVLFGTCSNPLVAARYHSLALDRVPEDCILTAWDKDKEIMGIQHWKYPVFGIQFHPESFLTPEGPSILERFLHV